MAKAAAGGLLGILQAAAQAGVADLWKEAAGEVAEEFGGSHILAHLARGAAQHYGKTAEASAREHGYDWQPQPPPQPAQGYVSPPQAYREPTADELWTAGRNARSAGRHDFAVQCFAAAAEKGHAGGAAAVANYFHQGQHVEQSHRTAALWYQRAIEAGERTQAPDALNRIGQLFQRGEQGAPLDVDTAFRLYRIAARAGDMHAQFNAAWYLWRGKGVVEPDRAEARRLFILSASQGYAPAAEKLAQMDAEDRPRIAGGKQEPPRRPTGEGRMSRARALEILDIGEGTGSAAMKAAWTRLMQQNHPDKGGSNYFAKELNEARQVLGF